MGKFPGLSEKIQDYSVVTLLVLTPLARGSTPRWAFCLTLLLALLAFTAMFLKRLWTDKRVLPRTPLDWFWLVALAIAFASLIGSLYREATYWALARLALYLGVFYLAFEAARYRRRARLYVWTIISLGAALSFIGLIKYMGAPLPSFWIYGLPGQEKMITATYMNHNHLAGYLEMSLSLGAGLLLFRAARNPWVLGWLLALMLFTLIWTMSRGGWIGLAAGLTVLTLLLCRKNKVRRLYVRLGLAALLALVIVVFLGSGPVFERAVSMDDPREPSFLARLHVWSHSTELIRENPLLGTGLGAFPWAFTQVRPVGLALRYREAHGDYVQIVVETGLLILIPIVWGGTRLYRLGVRRLDRTESRFMAGLTAGALGGVSALLVHSFGDFNLQLTANGLLFAVLLGLIVGPSRWKAEAGRKTGAAPDDEPEFTVVKTPEVVF
ncbi:MAG: O-antigen ligase family protein [Thermodesulfobacteriota bacterium]